MAGELDFIKSMTKDQEIAFLRYAEQSHTLLVNQFSMRSALENIDRDYAREKNFTIENLRARAANRNGDASRFQDITVPIIMPQVNSALGYMTNVFCTGYPIFGVAGDPSVSDAALAMETIIGENSVTAGWVRQLLMFFRDGLKYNLHALEMEWQQQTTYSVESDVANPAGAKAKEVIWSGNVMKRMDLYNTFFDPRVHPAEIHQYGEFAGYIEVMSRIRMKDFFNKLFNKIPVPQVLKALESAPPTAGLSSGSGAPFSYYIPNVNPEALIDRTNWTMGMDWMAWSQGTIGNKPRPIRYSNVYEVQKLYARILPADFGMRVPEANTPQVWKFIIINGQVVVVAERLSNAHNFIPIFFGQPLEDGLDFQAKSFAQNVTDMQAIASACANGYIASKRRLIGDRVLYDPMRIRKEDIASDSPTAKIPVRPSAFGKPVSESVYAFPFHDEQTSSFLTAIEQISKMANMINQQNQASQGQFVKGNKTKHEYDDVMGHGNTNNQVMALMSEAQVFTPLKEAMKLNILQYQADTTLFNVSKGTEVKVDIQGLRKAAVHFRVSDGMLPSDKILSGEEFQTALQVIGNSPQLQGEYNLGDMFSYLMKERGADLTPFQKSQLQRQFEQMQTAWSQTCAAMMKANPQMDPKTLPPQPEMPPELIKELQQKQQNGGVVTPGIASKAFDSTVGAPNEGAAA